MKFDFIFEQVYESNNGKYPQMNYFPILVVEFDGPHHDTEEQKKLDLYKNGITDKIGAGMVRMRYDEVENLSETELRKVYEDEIIEELVKGYFKKRRYQIGKENLIRDDSKKYQRLCAAGAEKRGAPDRCRNRTADRVYGRSERAPGDAVSCAGGTRQRHWEAVAPIWHRKLRDHRADRQRAESAGGRIIRAYGL